MKMNSTDFIKSEPFLSPQSVGAGTTNTTGLDLKDADDALITLYVGTMAATATVVAKLQESETVGGTYTDIATSTLSIDQAVGTPGDTLYQWEVDCRLRKRFVRLNIVSALAAALLSVEKQLTKPRERPVTHSANSIVVAKLRN